MRKKPIYVDANKARKVRANLSKKRKEMQVKQIISECEQDMKYFCEICDNDNFLTSTEAPKELQKIWKTRKISEKRKNRW